MTDERLWVRLRDAASPRERWYIVGNAHKSRGEFTVLAPPGRYTSVHRGDLASCSIAADQWIDAFVVGQMPTLWEFLGCDEEIYEALTAADIERWHDGNELFRRRGQMPQLQVMPPRDLDLRAYAAPAPWVYVGGLYRVWRDGSWLVADLQPGPKSELAWPGTPCEAPGRHTIVAEGAATMCTVCHWICV